MKLWKIEAVFFHGSLRNQPPSVKRQTRQRGDYCIFPSFVLIVSLVAELVSLWYTGDVFSLCNPPYLPKYDQMTIRKIYEYPAPVLRHETEPITAFDESLQKLVEDMAETMYAAPGIGLAAPQIGESLKLIVVDTSRDKEGPKEYMAMVNPEIVEHEGSQLDEEGCLSVPDLTSKVKRFRKITVTYQDLAGDRQQLETENRFAVVLQHEIDHINGILFLDHLSPLKRTLYKKKVKKWLAGDHS